MDSDQPLSADGGSDMPIVSDVPAPPACPSRRPQLWLLLCQNKKSRRKHDSASNKTAMTDPAHTRNPGPHGLLLPDSNPGGASCLSSASAGQLLIAPRFDTKKVVCTEAGGTPPSGGPRVSPRPARTPDPGPPTGQTPTHTPALPKLVLLQTRRQVHPRSSRHHVSNLGNAIYRTGPSIPGA